MVWFFAIITQIIVVQSASFESLGFIHNSFFGAGQLSNQSNPDDVLSSSFIYSENDCINLSGDYYSHNPDDGTLKTVAIQQSDCVHVAVSSKEGCFSEYFKLILDGHKRPASDQPNEMNYITSSWKNNQMLVIFESNRNDDLATYVNLYSLDQGTNLVRSTTMIDRSGVSHTIPDDVFVRIRRQDVRPIAND